MYKISCGKSPKFMDELVEIFDTKYHTSSHHGVKLDEDGNVESLNKKLNYHPQKSSTSSIGLETLETRSLGPKIWELISDNVRHVKSPSAFENELKKLNIDRRPCKFCRDYIHGVGYIN